MKILQGYLSPIQYKRFTWLCEMIDIMTVADVTTMALKSASILNRKKSDFWMTLNNSKILKHKGPISPLFFFF